MSADETCGDYPAPCNCDDPETHDGAVTAAGRPSVTDNARDEEPLAWCPGCGDRILTRVVRERGVCSECWGTRDDPWAAGRTDADIRAAMERRRRLAEMTRQAFADGLYETAAEDYAEALRRARGKNPASTSTIEDAEEVLHGAGWFARADLDPRDLRGILHDLADADLLTKARTRPTREQIDRAVGEVLSNAANHPDPVAVLGRSIAPLRTKVTDAVLALLRGGAQ